MHRGTAVLRPAQRTLRPEFPLRLGMLRVGAETARDGTLVLRTGAEGIMPRDGAEAPGLREGSDDMPRGGLVAPLPRSLLPGGVQPRLRPSFQAPS